MTEFRRFIEMMRTPLPVDLLPQIAAARGDDRCPRCQQADGLRVYHKHYHCFACGAHGDAIQFVMVTEGLHFMPAVDWIMDRYGGGRAA